MELEEKAEELATGEENRRTAPRYGVEEDARLLLVAHGSTVPCRIVDLSLSGCRLRTKERFPAGSMVRVEINFKVRGLAFRFGGITQWTDGRSLVGIRFVDVPARRREELVEALSEVEAENAAKQAAEKRAAEEQVAAKRAAEEQAAALQAVATLVAEPAEEEARRQSPAQAMAARNLPLPRALPVPHRAGGPQPVPKAETAVAGLSGPLGALGPAKPRPAPQRPVEQGLSGSSQPAALQKAEARPAGPPPPKPTKRERRTQSREEVDTSAVIQLINIASLLTGRIIDLSVGGCRIRTDERFPVGIYTRVETEFHLEGLPFRLGGVIQAIHDQRLVGIRFLDMSSRKREQVEQLIEEIRALREQGTGNREQAEP